jgi:beta-galactosidase
VVQPAPEENVARTTSTAKPEADAGFSGAQATVPAAMLDGTTGSGGWSSFYNKAATALLPAVSAAHPSEWVSVRWPQGQGLTGSVQAYFTVNATRQLPKGLVLSYWDGSRYVPVHNQEISWAAESNQPTRITFDPVATTSLRVDMASAAPWTNTGFLQIAELEVAGHPVG